MTDALNLQTLSSRCEKGALALDRLGLEAHKFGGLTRRNKRSLQLILMIRNRGRRSNSVMWSFR